MVVGEGNKGVYRRKYQYVVYGYDFKLDLDGFVIPKEGLRVANYKFKQIVSGKLTQWEDYT